MIQRFFSGFGVPTKQTLLRKSNVYTFWALRMQNLSPSCFIFIQQSHLWASCNLDYHLQNPTLPPSNFVYCFLYIDYCQLDCADDAFCSTDDALFIKYNNTSLLRAANYQSSDNVWPNLPKSYQWSDMMIRWINKRLSFCTWRFAS